MDFELSSEQHDLVERTRDYAQRVVRPAAARLEQLTRAEDFPFDLMREGTALGLKALPLPPELGGRGADMVTQCLVADCRVGADHAVTAVGEGYTAAERGLIAANITNAAMCLGIARAAYDAALDWSLDRVQGGVPIHRHQLVAHDLGRMRILLDAARSYLLRAAWEYSSAPAFDPELSWGVRVYGADVAIEVTQKALFLFGGRGIMADHPVEKLARDALTMTHGNGTSALMTLRVGEHQAERRLAARGAAPPPVTAARSAGD